MGGCRSSLVLTLSSPGLGGRHLTRSPWLPCQAAWRGQRLLGGGLRAYWADLSLHDPSRPQADLPLTQLTPAWGLCTGVGLQQAVPGRPQGALCHWAVVWEAQKEAHLTLQTSWRGPLFPTSSLPWGPSVAGDKAGCRFWLRGRLRAEPKGSRPPETASVHSHLEGCQRPLDASKELEAPQAGGAPGYLTPE